MLGSYHHVPISVTGLQTGYWLYSKRASINLGATTNIGFNYGVLAMVLMLLHSRPQSLHISTTYGRQFTRLCIGLYQASGVDSLGRRLLSGKKNNKSLTLVLGCASILVCEKKLLWPIFPKTGTFVDHYPKTTDRLEYLKKTLGKFKYIIRATYHAYTNGQSVETRSRQKIQ